MDLIRFPDSDVNGTYEQWEQRGYDLKAIKRGFDAAWAFAVGWWLLEGERQYGEMYSQALGILGLEYQTLANYKWLANVYSREDVAMFPELGLIHFKICAGIRDRETRLSLLALAQDQGLTGRQLESELPNSPRITSGTKDDTLFEYEVENGRLKKEIVDWQGRYLEVSDKLEKFYAMFVEAAREVSHPDIDELLDSFKQILKDFNYND